MGAEVSTLPGGNDDSRLLALQGAGVSRRKYGVEISGNPQLFCPRDPGTGGSARHSGIRGCAMCMSGNKGFSDIVVIAFSLSPQSWITILRCRHAKKKEKRRRSLE